MGDGELPMPKRKERANLRMTPMSWRSFAGKDRLSDQDQCRPSLYVEQVTQHKPR